jgi:hypothetical protein
MVRFGVYDFVECYLWPQSRASPASGDLRRRTESLHGKAALTDLAPAIAPIALSGFDDALGLRAPIGGKRAADVVALLKFAFRVPTNIPFVAFVRLYQFTSRSHWFLL